jgi:flagellar basal body-associated protein FliL
MTLRKINPFLIAYAVGLIVLAAAGYACADFTMRADETHKELMREAKAHTDVAFVDVPRLNLMLPSFQGQRTGRVRMDIALEIDKKYTLELQGMMPRISARIADYARTIDIKDVTPPDATRRLRQNLLQEAAAGGFPIPIIDVIFKQFVIM